MARKSKAILFTLFLALTLVTPQSALASEEYASIQDVDQEILFLGDTLRIGTDLCWRKKNPTQTQAKIKLQIFFSNRWQSVGKVIYMKDNVCKKNYYAQFFLWEVDRLGYLQSNGLSGKLQIRNIVTSPSQYAEIIVYSSQSTYNKELIQQGLDIAKKNLEAAKLEKARLDLARREMECIFLSGTWTGTYCIGKPGL